MWFHICNDSGQVISIKYNSGSHSLAKISPSSNASGPAGTGTRESQLTASHLSVSWGPEVITDCPPLSIPVDLQTAGSVGGTGEPVSHQSQVTRTSSCYALKWNELGLEHLLVTSDQEVNRIVMWKIMWQLGDKSGSGLGMRLENLFMQNSVNYNSKLSDEKLSRRKQEHLICRQWRHHNE